MKWKHFAGWIGATMMAASFCRGQEAERKPEEPVDTSGRVAVAAKIGSLGGTLEGTLGLNPWLNLRGNINYLSFGYDGSMEDVDYRIEPDLLCEMVLLDVHPFGNNFRLTAGIVFDQSELRLTAVPGKEVDLGGVEYPPGAVGTLEGKLSFETIAPYAGIGFGNAVASEGHWSFSFDLGVVFQSHDIALSATGPASSDPQFIADLKREEEDVQDSLDQFPFLPALSFGVAFRF